MRTKSYAGDPYWLTLRFRGQCKRCKADIKPGEQAFRYKDGSLFCDSENCGRECSRAFHAAAADEDFTNGGY